VQKLRARLHGWQIFDDALLNTQGDFTQALRMLRDVGTDEPSFGVWLLSMMTHDDIQSRLRDNPVLLQQAYPPLLLTNENMRVSHDDFLRFVRAYIGVACVVVLFAWADSLPDEQCKAK
jgi:hypothetical protein